MPLPLLALAGLGLGLGGAGLALEGPINDRRDRKHAERLNRQYRRGMGEEVPRLGIFGSGGDGQVGDPLRGTRPNDPKFNEAGALFYGGNRQYDVNNFMDDRNQQFLADRSDAAAMARTQVSAGAANRGVALREKQWAANPQNPESANYIDPSLPYDPKNDEIFQRWHAQQDYLRGNELIDAERDRLAKQALFDAQPIQYDLSSAEGQRLVQTNVTAANNANAVVQNVDEAMRWVTESGGISELWNRSDQKSLEAQAALQNMPFVAAKVLETGVIGDEERPMIERMSQARDMSSWGDKDQIAGLAALREVAMQHQNERYSQLSNSNVQDIFDKLGLHERYEPQFNLRGGAINWPAREGR